MNQDLEQVVFHYILKNTNLTEQCKPEFFNLSYLRELFKILKPYVMKYQAIPSAEQVIKLISISDINDDIKQYLTPNIITQLWAVANTLNNYDEEWLSNTVKAFLSWSSLIDGVQNAATYIKTVQSDVNTENYQEIVDKAKNIFTRNSGIDFNNLDDGVNLYDPEAHKTKKLARHKSGYSFIDLCSKGGYWAGSLWVFLGAPKAGKSRMLQNLCAQAIRMGDDCAYLSFELQEEIITQRIGSNLFNLPIDNYDQYADDTNVMSAKIKEFRTQNIVTPGLLKIKAFPTSAASVNDIESWLLKQEEKISANTGKPFKFKNVYVDYINLIKNWRNPNSENLYMKIKQIAEDLRAIAMKNKWCIITATQVKQSFFDAGDMDMSAASESSALAATVDMMFGIISDTMMKAGHILYLKILANRVSGHINERKKYNIDEKYMRLSEDISSPIIRDEDINENFAKKSKDIVNGYNKYQQYKNNTINLQSQGTQTVFQATLPPNPNQQPIQPNLGMTEAALRNANGLFGSLNS